MAKRSKKESAPNIPKEVLDRVREEKAQDDDSELSAEEARLQAERRAERAARRAARRQKTVTGEKPKREELGASVVAEMLANPTAEVNEEELRVQYDYVLSDLRNMGILALILFLVLIGLGFLI